MTRTSVGAREELSRRVDSTVASDFGYPPGTPGTLTPRVTPFEFNLATRLCSVTSVCPHSKTFTAKPAIQLRIDDTMLTFSAKLHLQ